MLRPVKFEGCNKDHKLIGKVFTEHRLRQLRGCFLTDLYTTRLLFAPEESPPAGHLKECRFKALQSNAQVRLQPCLMKPTFIIIY